MSPADWELPWLGADLLARELVKLRVTPKTKRELERLAELRRSMIYPGWFN